MLRLLNRILTALLINILVFALVVYLFEGVDIAPYLVSTKDQIRVLILAGLCLGVLNLLLKPVLKFFTFPLIVLTLGLFLFVINIFMLFLTTYLVPDLVIQGLANYIYVALIFSLVNTLEHFFNKKKS